MSSSSINSRLKGLGFGSKRKSGSSATTTSQDDSPNSPPQLQYPQLGRPISSAASSSTSLPMTQSVSSARPPSYTNNLAPAPSRIGRQSPMLSNTRNAASQPISGGSCINTANPGYSASSTVGGIGGPAPTSSGPPGYGPPQYTTMTGSQAMTSASYMNRNNAVEVEGAGRSKAQLIVGIDFVRHLIRKCKAVLISSGNYVFRCRLRFCDEQRGKGRHYYRMARSRILHQAEGTTNPPPNQIFSDVSRFQPYFIMINIKKSLDGDLISLMLWHLLATRNLVFKKLNGSSFNSCSLVIHTSTLSIYLHSHQESQKSMSQLIIYSSSGRPCEVSFKRL